MSHGDRITRLPPGFHDDRRLRRTRRIALIADEARRYYGLMFHPEVVHTPDGARADRQFRPQGRRAEERLDDGGVPRRGARGDPPPGRQGPRDLRPLRRRRFGGRRGADPRGDRRPADLRLRRPRPDAPGRGRRGGAAVPRPFQHPAGPRRGGASCSSARSKGVAEPEDKRKTIGRLFIEMFEGEAKKIAATGAARSNFSRRGRSTPT